MSSTATAVPAQRTLLLGTSRRHGFGFWAVAYAFLVLMAYCAVPTPLYTLYQQRDGFSSFMITVVFGIYAVGVVISLFTVGHLSDWHGRRRVLAPAIVLAIASAVVFLLWQSLGALLLARFVSGLAVGAVTATATAWLAELHAVNRPGASPRRAQIVATAANLGGIGCGPLVAGILAEWVAHPLTIPFISSIGALTLALGLVVLSPETREPPVPRPRYRPQGVSVPGEARRRYFAAAVGVMIAFAAFGLFTSLAPSFLAVTLHQGSRALAGATAFAVFAAAAVAQLLIARRSPRSALANGIGTLLSGLAVLVVAVYLPDPSLVLFILGGILAGAGAGMLFKGILATVSELAIPDRRAEALAGMFLAGYLGISVPVIGLGVLTEYASTRFALLVFAAVLALSIILATPALLADRGFRGG